VAQWSLTSLREKVVKIDAKVVAHGRRVVFQMAEVAVPREAVRPHPRPDREAAPRRTWPLGGRGQWNRERLSPSMAAGHLRDEER